MIVATTIILIVAMICGTALTFGYWAIIHEDVNEYTLRDAKQYSKDTYEEIKKVYARLEEIERRIEEQNK